MLKLALRHLFAKPRQTLLIFLGVTFGSLGFVTISGLFLGFREFLVDQLVNNDAHVKITVKENLLSYHSLDNYFFDNKYLNIFWFDPPAGKKNNSKIEDFKNWLAIFASDPRVDSFSPHYSAPANLSQKGVSLSVNLFGINPAQEEKVTTLKNYMVVGKLTDISVGGNRLICGDSLLDKLGATIGQTVTLSVRSGQNLPFKIVGKFHTGLDPFDSTRAYGSLANIQRAAGNPNVINEIAVHLKDYSVANEVASSWSYLSEDKIQSWDMISQNIFSVFKIQDATRFLVIAIVLVVAGFGIYNVLNMAVNQKKKEIAILRSMGFQSQNILMLFFYQGILIGLSGGIVGLFLGYFACLYIQTIPFNSTGSQTNMMHISFQPQIYINAFFLAMLASIVASVLPARAASKLTPIDIIRAGTE